MVSLNKKGKGIITTYNKALMTKKGEGETFTLFKRGQWLKKTERAATMTANISCI